jgi:diguanylate cyclase (GGDEF)-like protein
VVRDGSDCESDGRLLYLAGQLASLHATADYAALAARFEFLGEKALGASLSVLARIDEGGVLRALPLSPQAPATVRALHEQLGVPALGARAAAILALVEGKPGPVVAGVDAVFGVAPASPGATALVVPIARERELMGAGIFIAEPDELNVQLASIIAAHVAVAMHQMRRRDDARRLHGLDPVLWIPDEDFLLDQLRREISRARRYDRDLGIALLRLENEPELRTQFGDFFTDHLLRRIGSRILAQIRDSDVLGAYAGGYAIIHNETSLEGTRLSAERLRAAAQRMVAQHFAEIPRVDLSVAVAAFPEGGSTSEELISSLTSGAPTAIAAASSAQRLMQSA